MFFSFLNSDTHPASTAPSKKPVEEAGPKATAVDGKKPAKHVEEEEKEVEEEVEEQQQQQKPNEKPSEIVV